jgi:hypothetical protein
LTEMNFTEPGPSISGRLADGREEMNEIEKE